MKKYIKSLLISLIIGLFLSVLFFKQYSSNKSIRTSLNKNFLYFIQYGVYSNENSMEENTINLQNYVYNIDDGKYYVYVGITSNENNKNKIVDYYNSLGRETIVKEYAINNKEFIERLLMYDDVLMNTDDTTTISSVTNQVLQMYEEVVINGGKD